MTPALVRRSLPLFPAVLVMLLAACPGSPVSQDESVSGRAQVFDRVSAALTAGSIRAIKGTYGATCVQRTGAWAIALNGYAFTGGEVPLSVILSDTGCSLSVTAVKAGELATPLTYTTATAFPLAATYAGVGVPFLLAGAGATQFFANFRIQPDLTFATDFTVQFVYSDDVNRTNFTIIPGHVVADGTATEGVVPAPNATMSVSSLAMMVDAGSVVLSTSGVVTLTQGTIVAEEYAIDTGALGAAPSFAAIDTYFSGAGATRVTLPAGVTTIPATALGIVGVDLSVPATRSVIVANIVSGVTAYQLFQIRFEGLPGAVGMGPAAIDLGAAASYAVLAASAITVGDNAGIVGDVGLCSATSAALTGFALEPDVSGDFSTSPVVTGELFATDHGAATQAALALALSNEQDAWTDGMSRGPADGVNPGAGELGGLVVTPGLYAFPGAVGIGSDVTFNGSAEDTWILQVNGALVQAAGAEVLLVGGATAANIVWVVTGAVSIGATAQFEGVILSQASIGTGDSATVTGRLLSQVAVTLGANSVVTQPLP